MNYIDLSKKLTRYMLFGMFSALIIACDGDDDDDGSPAGDTTPESFEFMAETDVELGATVESNTITVNGVNTFTPIAIVNGEYKVGDGVYTSSPSSVRNGNEVTVRVTASDVENTSTGAVLTIGGVSATFTVTTLDVPEDTTPAAFTFTDVSGAMLSTTVESDAITVAEIDAPADISITGGMYKIGDDDYTSDAGTVSVGETVMVQVMSSDQYEQSVSATLTIGGVTDTFQVTTMAAPDTTQEPFTLGTQADVTLQATVESSVITVAGIDAEAAISITGGMYKIGDGEYTMDAGTVMNGDMVQVSLVASTSYATASEAELTIGGVSDTFTVTTLPEPDTTPDAFTFMDQTDVAISTNIESNAITVAGIDAMAAISVVDGEYKIGDGAYTGAAGMVSNGDMVMVRVMSSADPEMQTSVTLTIGGVSDTFSVTTVAADDTTPDAFDLGAAVTDAALDTVVESSTFTVAGIDADADISITNGEYRIDGGAYTSADGTVANGQEVQVRVTSSDQNDTEVVTTLTIGGVTDTFSVTTELAANDSTPDAFTFTDQTDVDVSTNIESNAITVAGINVAADISITGGMYKIGAGAYTAAAGTVNVGDMVMVQVMSSGDADTETSATLTIGGISDTFSVTTAAAADTTKPEVTIAFPPPTSLVPTTRTTIHVRGTVTDAVGTIAMLTVDGNMATVNGDGTWSADVPIVAGDNTIEVVATDDSDNASDAVSVEVLVADGVSFPNGDDPVGTGPDQIAYDANNNRVLHVDRAGTDKPIFAVDLETGVRSEFANAPGNNARGIAVVGDTVYSTAWSTDNIVSFDMTEDNTGTTGTVFSMGDDVLDPHEIVHDEDNNRLLVASSPGMNGGKIVAVSLADGTVSDFSNGAVTFDPESMTLVPARGAEEAKLYFTSRTTGTTLTNKTSIFVAPLSTGTVSVYSDNTEAVMFTQPSAITYDSANDRFLVVDLIGDNPDRIIAIDLDDPSARTVFSATSDVDITTSEAILAHPSLGYVLVSDLGSDSLIAIDLESEERVIITKK